MKTTHRNLINQGHYAITIPILTLFALVYWMFGLDFLALSISVIGAWLFWSVMVPK